MIKRWIFYLGTLGGTLAFWLFSPSWFSRYLFLMVQWLPLFSLAASLVPMLLSKSSLQCPQRLSMGADAWAEIVIQNKLPRLHYRSKLTLTHSYSGETQIFRDGDDLPTQHCGWLQLKCRRLWLYDYLGLFRIPFPRPKERSILIRPTPIPMDKIPGFQQGLQHSWKPKPGGGFAENHELRLYRPGDSLNQIHWKLTAKTGKLTIREAMVPQHGKVLLTVDISGTCEELDRKMGRLLWLGQYILQQGMAFYIRATANEGAMRLPITNETELEKVMDQLLCLTPTQTPKADDETCVSLWRFHIGGEPDAQ